MHVIQQRLASGHGTQCGFCSPGFVMSLYALLRNNPLPSDREIDEAIRGCSTFTQLILESKTQDRLKVLNQASYSNLRYRLLRCFYHSKMYDKFLVKEQNAYF